MENVEGPFGSERPMLPPGTLVTTGPKLLLMATSGSMVLMQLESVLMSVMCYHGGPC